MKTIFRKFKDWGEAFLLVKRVETENKWWHRLFTVFLFGSAIIVLVVSTIGAVDSYDRDWGFAFQSVAFSLEPHYQNVSGKELACNVVFDSSPSRRAGSPLAIISCDGIDIPYSNAIRYYQMYEDALEKLRVRFGFDKYSTANCPSSLAGSEKFSPEQIACIKEMWADEKADPSYATYQDSLKKLAHIKVARDIHYWILLGDIALWLAIPLLTVLLWFVFWSSIIYRTALYIIFGAKK